MHYGENLHHIAEAVFKAVGRALAEATRLTRGRGRSVDQRQSLTDMPRRERIQRAVFERRLRRRKRFLGGGSRKGGKAPLRVS